MKLEEYFLPLVTAWTNWHEEILTYFEHRVTNAFTESLNNLIRVMNRLGRGYSFDALRAKILFTEGIQKKTKPKFERRREEPVFGMLVAESSTRYAETEKNYGADISTLIRMLEEGKL